jgi:DNA-binding NarL/FixJ family response regulator
LVHAKQRLSYFACVRIIAGDGQKCNGLYWPVRKSRMSPGRQNSLAGSRRFIKLSTLMSKQRPRKSTGHLAAQTPDPPDLGSSSARFWQNRVFKNSFTRKGRHFKVKRWSIKIQFQGQRRSFSLSARSREAAGLEAEAIHNTIVRSGWEAATRFHKVQRLVRDQPARHPGELHPVTNDLAYWKRRLIRRKYIELVRPSAASEFSVRIEHEDNYNYFPLRTADESQAGARALEIYQTILARGWKTACEQFTREIAVAIFWAANPMACTYTTLLTLPENVSAPDGQSEQRASSKRLMTVEADADIQRTLGFWLNRQPGFKWAGGFNEAEAVLPALQRRPTEMLLVNRLLPEATQLLDALKRRTPDLPVFTYGIYEESDQIFVSVSGVEAGYLLRRRMPGALLEPIQGALRSHTFSATQVFRHVSDYFQSFFQNSPATKASLGVFQLTNREHEILSYVSKGYIDKEIAQVLSISVWTVHNHLKSSYEKLKVRTRTEAAMRFLQK